MLYARDIVNSATSPFCCNYKSTNIPGQYECYYQYLIIPYQYYNHDLCVHQLPASWCTIIIHSRPLSLKAAILVQRDMYMLISWDWVVLNFVSGAFSTILTVVYESRIRMDHLYTSNLFPCKWPVIKVSTWKLICF